FNALVLGVFGATALLLAVVGIYGVISCAVAQRTHEIGIRTALGAQPRDVLSLVLGRALALTGAGIALGLGASLGLTRLIGALLYDVKPADAVTLVAVTLGLGAVSVLASYLPTRRAMRLDPLIALKGE